MLMDTASIRTREALRLHSDMILRFTRNHHGVGFWDREHEGLPKDLGDKLTRLAQEHGHSKSLIEPDGSIYYG